MAKSTLIYSAGSFVLGAALSGVLVSSFAGKNKVQRSEHADSSYQDVVQSANASKVANQAVAGNGSALQADLTQIEGVQQMIIEDEKNDLVVVPTSLLGKYSKSSTSQILRAGLFANSKEIQQALKITDQEKAQMQRNWREVRKQMKRVERDAAKVEELENGAVKIQVPDLKESYMGLGRDFEQSLVNVLGENRATAFSAAQHLEGVFSPVGEASYTIRMESTGNGYWRYHISQSGAQGGGTWVGTKVPVYLRHLTERANIVSELKTPAEESEEE